MDKKKLTGAIIATAVAGLFLAGHGLAEEKAGEMTKEGKVHCMGINSCAGKGACKSADNACKGKNSCKGKGWLPTETEKECTDKGGKVMASN